MPDNYQHMEWGWHGGVWGWWHIIIYVIYALILIIPAWRILTRVGFHPAFSLLAAVPVINVIMLWVFAFIGWPRDKMTVPKNPPMP